MNIKNIQGRKNGLGRADRKGGKKPVAKSPRRGATKEKPSEHSKPAGSIQESKGLSIEQWSMDETVEDHGPQGSSQDKTTKRYEELGDDVKNATLTDNRNYFVIRHAMDLPEPEFLVGRQGYVPMGPFKNDLRFTLRGPTDPKTMQVTEVKYHIGKTISQVEALKIKTLYNELIHGDGPGRPSNNEELVKFGAKFGPGIRRQHRTITGGKLANPPLSQNNEHVGADMNEPNEDPRAGKAGTEAVTTSMKPIKSAGLTRSNEVAVALGKVDEKFPLASWLVKRVSSDAVAMTEIGEVAVALVLCSKGKDVDGETLNLLRAKADNPREFSMHIKDTLVDLFNSMKPEMVHRNAVLEGALHQWYQWADGIDAYYLHHLENQKRLAVSAERRADIAVRLLPPNLQAEYDKIMLFAEDYPSVAEQAIARNRQMPSAPPYQPALPPPHDESKFDLEKFAVDMAGMRKQIIAMKQAGYVNPYRDADTEKVFMDGTITPGLLRKYAENMEKEAKAQANKQGQNNRDQGN